MKVLAKTELRRICQAWTAGSKKIERLD